MWLIFLFWIEGTSWGRWMGVGGCSPALRRPALGSLWSVFIGFRLLKIRLFAYQYFTSASRESQQMNCSPANGWRWKIWTFQTNTHNKNLHTHTSGLSFDWPSEMRDGSQNSTDAEESRDMFYLGSFEHPEQRAVNWKAFVKHTICSSQITKTVSFSVKSIYF